METEKIINKALGLMQRYVDIVEYQKDKYALYEAPYVAEAKVIPLEGRKDFHIELHRGISKFWVYKGSNYEPVSV